MYKLILILISLISVNSLNVILDNSTNIYIGPYDMGLIKIELNIEIEFEYNGGSISFNFVGFK